MSIPKLTTRQMIDTIRKGDRLGHEFLQGVADRLERLEAERAKQDALKAITTEMVTIYFKTVNGGNGVRSYEMPCEKHGQWAVHEKIINSDDRDWGVTHAPSGLSVGHFYRYDIATRCAEELERELPLFELSESQLKEVKTWGGIPKDQIPAEFSEKCASIRARYFREDSNAEVAR